MERDCEKVISSLNTSLKKQTCNPSQVSLYIYVYLSLQTSKSVEVNAFNVNFTLANNTRKLRWTIINRFFVADTDWLNQVFDAN